jgi:hypothetical protein
MSEPLFFDCLTDTQIWSLFDAGVLHDYRLPVDVYERLERLAPEHGYYLFTGPPGVALPTLQELVPDMAEAGGDRPDTAQTPGLETPSSTDVMRTAIQAWCARAQTDGAPAGRRIYLVATMPYPSLRPGPYLELQVRDLNAMSMPELEAYLDDVLRVDEASIRC